jgi:hypothetical protein
MKYMILILILISTTALASLCGDKRLTPSNYPFKYKKVKRVLKKYSSNSFIEKFNSLDKNETELCAWNRFLFVDFMIYYNRFKGIGIDKKTNLIDTLKLRDSLYQIWLNKNIEGVYSDYSAESLRGESLEDFLNRSSEKFGYITKPLKVLNRRPKKNKARAYVYDLLEARSPFNSIFPKIAMKLLVQNQTMIELECVLSKIKLSFKDKFKSCFPNEDRLLKVLGILASQRMYLIRDFSHWAKENYDEEKYNLFYKNASLSSLLYFKLETQANEYGAHEVHIMSSSELKTPKPYHFYSVAFIANQMVKENFSETEIRDNASFYAQRYKKSISKVGIFYNILAGIKLKHGAVGDKKQVIKEQKLAIEYILEKEQL